MASVFCAISFIKTFSNANKFTAGVAIYRVGDDKFVEYKFKAFRSEYTTLIEKIYQNNIALIIGRFAFEKEELNITINQYVLLNVSTLGDDTTIYDLPVAPAFGIFTAPIQDPAITEILIPLTKSSFILCETIEWNYPTSFHNTSSNSTSNTNSNQSNKCQRLQDLERIAEKFNSHSPSTQHLYKKPHFANPRDPTLNLPLPDATVNQLRINQLRSTIDNIKGNTSTPPLKEALDEPTLNKDKTTPAYGNNTNEENLYDSTSSNTYLHTTVSDLSDSSE
ncbi:9352_t:CDS:2 [Dentiscutata erythropus]|uniref:9352_t:CDS:1 n=1 Tax=Dentiscutata erythropus TaxID=1348616 RepID=A0A9N9HP80_9GLOM|nr:9352_t:CDS:2 [Dentiscutata erythropus]